MANGVGSAAGRSKRDQMPKQIRLNAFDMNCVGHQSPGLWTHPRDRSDRYNTLDYWVELAKLGFRSGARADHGRGITIPDTESTQTRRSWTALTPGTFSAATRRAARSRSSVIVPLSTTTPLVTITSTLPRGPHGC